MADVADVEPHIRASAQPRERAIAALATRQHGVVAQRQLRQLGLGPRAIQYRLHVGRLHPIHRGVYAVGHPVLRPEGWALAAVLACGPGAVLSHRSAAERWGLLASARTAVDVTAPARGRRSRPRITVHGVRRLHPTDCTVNDGIPTTTVARTLLDLAEVVPPRRLRYAVEQAERMGVFNGRGIAEVCARSAGRRGLKPLRSLLSDGCIESNTRSDLERRFLDLCETSGVPRPRVNVLVGGFEVDALWADRNLIVELDGYAHHGTRSAFERDRARDAELQLGGYRVLRFTYRQLDRQPLAIVETLLRAMGRLGP